MLGSVIIDGVEHVLDQPSDPVIGWKILEFDYIQGDFYGPYYKTSAFFGEFMKAKCEDQHYTSYEHPTPDPKGRCQCGFNLYKDKVRASFLLREALDTGRVEVNGWETTQTKGRKNLVLCKVEAYGRVVEYDRGYRAEYQRVIEVFVPENENFDAADVRRLYGVDATDMVKKFPLPLPREVKGLQFLTMCESHFRINFESETSRQYRTKRYTLGEDTGNEVRTAKNGNKYVYRGYWVSWPVHEYEFASLQTRAIVAFWNPKSKTVTFRFCLQVQKLTKDGRSVNPCRSETWVMKENNPHLIFKAKKGGGFQVKSIYERRELPEYLRVNIRRMHEMISELISIYPEMNESAWSEHNRKG